jgi:hypothetical protein
VLDAGVELPPSPPPPPHAATAILKSIIKSNLVVFNFHLPESNLRLKLIGVTRFFQGGKLPPLRPADTIQFS